MRAEGGKIAHRRVLYMAYMKAHLCVKRDACCVHYMTLTFNMKCAVLLTARVETNRRPWVVVYTCNV